MSESEQFNSVALESVDNKAIIIRIVNTTLLETHFGQNVAMVEDAPSAKVQIDYRLRYAHTHTHATHCKLPMGPGATHSLYSSLVDS
jgi:hypothetical protein